MNIPDDKPLPQLSSSKVERLEKYRRWNTSWLGRVDSYLITAIVASIMGLFMRLFQRTRVYHRERLDFVKLPTMLLPNHVSIADDFFLCPPIFYWRSIFRYGWMPYHAPEEKNFFKGKILSYMMRKLKCVPLTRGAGFMQPGLVRLMELAHTDNMLWMYPEGGRTRTGDINRGKAGVGMILYRTHAQAIPIYHTGLHEVLPIGSRFPKLYKKIDIIVGNPIDFEDLFLLPDEPKTWQAIADRITIKLSELRDELDEILGVKKNLISDSSVDDTVGEQRNSGRIPIPLIKNIAPRVRWYDLKWQSTLANYLTVLRLILVPVFVYLFLSENLFTQISATLVFIFAAITDAIDGYVARKRNEVTNFGTFADPLADKLLTITTFFLIAFRKEFSAFFLNLFVFISLIATREIGITMLRIWAIDQGVPVKTSVWGKAKTGIQLGTLIGTLLYFNVRDILEKYGIEVEYLNDKTMVPVLHGLFFLCLVITIISGFLYLRNLSFQKKKRNDQ